MRVFLVGYMGSGKTRTGRNLAKALNILFKDLDQLFEERYHISILDFFQKYGEELFRNLEHELLLEHINDPQVVLSTGGGTPCFFNNMDLMNAHGITVYIKMSPSALFTRLSQTRKQRPVIDSKSGEDLRTFIEQQLRERETVYSKAQLVVDGINLNILRLSQIIGEYDVLKSSGELHGTYPDPQDHKGRVRD